MCRATNVDYRLDTPSARAFLGQFVKRIGRRISIFSDTEVKWLNDNPPLPCYAAYWNVLLSVWTKLSAAGQAFVSGSMSSARTSAVGAQTKLDTLYDRDYVIAATRACVVAPAP